MSTVRDVIEAHKDEILRSWVHDVGDSAFVEGLSPTELVGVMPDYLSSLGRPATTTDPAQLPEVQRELVERHMSSRLRQGATLNEVLSEFSSLSRCLAATLGRELEDDKPTTRDAASVLTELHQACVASMRIFNEQMLEDEQSMKRYLRLLQRIADNGPDGAGQPALIRQALALIQSAMGATAAVLRLDGVDPSHEQVIVSSPGAAGAEVEAYVRSLDLADQPSSIERRAGGGDPDHISYQPADALREVDVHTLVGVRLASRHALRGHLFVGAGRGRQLSPSDIRLLDSLGDALTVHLEHTQLRAALCARADEADAECRLRERFVAILASGLSEPLVAVRASAQSILDRAAPASAAAGGIIREIDRAVGMVEGLIDAYRIRAGQRIPVQIAHCDLSLLAGDVVEQLRVAHGDRFVLQADPAVRGFWSAEQLRRSIWNLATNGIKFGAGDAPVVVSVKRRAEVAEVAVTNQGPQVPREALAALVSPFGVARSGRGDPPGWGIGLTLVWGCADVHGGRVDVESSATAGTTFTIAIPYDARCYED